MHKCKDYEVPGLDLTAYKFLIEKDGVKNPELLKQIFTDHYKSLDAFNIHLNIEVKEVSGETPCSGCGGSNFLRTGTCHVCIGCGASQGCS